ncbi:hypothetical protein FOA43_000107 [Brettanomyces nanus]|uniref:Initiator tRNA phosphoribosyl transferase n=1 Tax=Eeniella nana TaxID=13502 RepID=A0A875RXR3_EENNA|nr:uncharacterized protein FOA43_000107 [Brettanomyces nanus]QPG72805.1 hypothetical protein FOA43_000107 [Brettanomyces nanus]
MTDPEILKDLKELEKSSRRSNLSIRNRLLSILHDHSYLVNLRNAVFKEFDVLFIPNERCGLWYLKHDEFPATCYFKSTDGHTGQWDFSTRRLNFHLLPLLASHDALVIVDSTRSGKKMSDAFSRTIPIWCSILGKMISPELSWNQLLFVPSVVSTMERETIIKKLDVLYEKFLGLDLSIPVPKPLRPFRPVWISPGSLIDASAVRELLNLETQQFQPLFLVTASKACPDGEDKMAAYTYVQGAADDHESWSRGLDSQMFWNHVECFSDVLTDESMVVSNVVRLVDSARLASSPVQTIVSGCTAFWDTTDVTQITSQIFLGKLQDQLPHHIDVNWKSNDFTLVVVLDESIVASTPHCASYPLTSGSKKSSRQLRKELPKIMNLIKSVLYADDSNRIILLCGDGSDLSVGVLLACLCMYYNENWTYRLDSPNINKVDKVQIHRHLARIVEKRRVNPSRATLNSVNYVLMS